MSQPDIEDRPDLNTGKPWSEMDLVPILDLAGSDIADQLRELDRVARAFEAF
jgi:hypothetical protein